jgi:UDP-N-acetylmuramate: L-alanyl-gamma-D-glutamyl-meso-diaminopimelate ligase
MHQLAISLRRKGYQVSGSDDEIYEPARSNLAEYGLLPPADGWYPERLDPDLDAVIVGMHAKADNPELKKARELGIPIYSFPEYVYQESRDKIRVVVGGSHGKTSTTAMIMHALRRSGRSFDYLVGARLEGFAQSVDITDAPILICEGDEYPASSLEKRPKFHFLAPHIAILTGIAWDHINVFPRFDLYLEQFRIFIGKIEPGGLLIYNDTDPVLQRLIQERVWPDLRLRPYGIPEYRIQNGKTIVTLEGEESSLRIFGKHNLLNLHAAYWVVRELGLDTRSYMASMSDFAGAAKRLELLASQNGSQLFRDFAHAPSKVRASIAAVKEQFPGRNLIAVLELHTYSSLNADFLSEYRGSLDQADRAAVFYSRHALELKGMPVLEESVVREGFEKASLEIFQERRGLEQWISSQSLEHSNLLLMSSGNFEGLDLAQISSRITRQHP